MVDETPVAPTEPQAPAPAPEVAPVVEAPAPSEPVVTESKAPVQPTLLGLDADEAAPVVEPEKPAEEKTPQSEPPKEGEEKSPEQKNDEAPKTEEPAPAPVYDFTLPEDFQKDEKFDKLVEKLGAFELDTKADHAKVQAFMQDLLTEHQTVLQETVTRIAEAQAAQWENTRAEWKETIEKDPELGGNRADTTKANIRRFIQTYGGSADEKKAFSEFMNETGVGFYPPLVRMIAKAGELLAEGRPLAAKPTTPSAPQGIQAKINKMYSS